jgi:ribosomal protein S18 acetylase RimI-like enzyme
MKALAMFATAQPEGHYRAGTNGTSELVTGAAVPSLNGVISTSRNADVEEIAAFAASPNLESVPWSVQVRGEHVDDAIAAAVGELGLQQSTKVPFMVKELNSRDARDSEANGAKVRRILADEADLYRMTMAAGFEGPDEIFSIFARRSLLEHASMRAYITEAGGAPVATSFGVLVGDLVGVFNIAVPPQHRRHGYGRAATATVLRDAYEEGARTAFLHSSPLGVPLYQAMGFHLAEKWTHFTP